MERPPRIFPLLLQPSIGRAPPPSSPCPPSLVRGKGKFREGPAAHPPTAAAAPGGRRRRPRTSRAVYASNSGSPSSSCRAATSSAASVLPHPPGGGRVFAILSNSSNSVCERLAAVSDKFCTKAMPGDARQCQAMPGSARRCQPFGTTGACSPPQKISAILSTNECESSPPSLWFGPPGSWAPSPQQESRTLEVKRHGHISAMGILLDT